MFVFFAAAIHKTRETEKYFPHIFFYFFQMPLQTFINSSTFLNSAVLWGRIFFLLWNLIDNVACWFHRFEYLRKFA